jgi:GxxExxY protein
MQKAQKGVQERGLIFGLGAGVALSGDEDESMKKNFIFELCDLIRETSFAIHQYQGPGHLEKIYENALAHRLRKLGLDVVQQKPLQVLDEDGFPLGDYYADLFVGNCLIIELKATRVIANEHIAQLLGYLRSFRQEHGLLINFGSPRLFIKKYVQPDMLPVAS